MLLIINCQGDLVLQTDVSSFMPIELCTSAAKKGRKKVTNVVFEKYFQKLHFFGFSYQANAVLAYPKGPRLTLTEQELKHKQKYFHFDHRRCTIAACGEQTILVDSKNKLPTVIHNKHHVLFEFLPTGGKHSCGLL